MISRRPAAAVRTLGLALLVLGVLAIVWVLVVWRWQDPVTGLYTAYEQHRLNAALERRFEAFPRGGALASSPGRRADAIAAAARRYRRETHAGEPIGRIVVSRLGLNMILVDGTDDRSLRKGPGRDLRSFMPGEGNLVYVAGHRTTFLAPFAHIERMRPGDRITVEMPYATFRYVVTTHRIVPADDLAVLRPRTTELLVLQACHPRFSAAERYLVEARLAAVPAPVRAFS